MSTPPVFLVDTVPAGEIAVLDGPEGHHAATVRRLRGGEDLVLTDGRGALARCEVLRAGKDHLELRVVRRATQQEPRPRVVLAQALVKGERGELAVELATEAGVDEVLPWRAARCVARWDAGPRGTKALARWRNTATASAKQARRSWHPEVREPVNTTALAGVIAAAARALVLHESAAACLPEMTLPTGGDLVLVVGPEGGITPEELAELAAAGATPVRLGRTVLRASTAAAVALGGIGMVTQRWSAG
ncbi:MAG: 16S rRNA (uracil(1498)-N(3))-methyltransferase [Sciscionella sp.]